MPLILLRAAVWLLLLLGLRAPALRVLQAMQAQAPRDVFAIATRAHLLAQSPAPEALRLAAADLRLLCQLQPEQAGPAFNLGYVLEKLGDWAEAEHAMARAVALDPKLDRAWYGLGLVRLQLGQAQAAIEAFKRNTELQPLSPYGWTQLARAHQRQQQPQEAQRIVEHLRGFEPQVAAALAQELKT